MDFIQSKPFLVAILAGACAQLLKVVSYLIIEKRVNYRRFVQTHGAPNMHATAFSALMVSVGLKDGFDSLPFSIAACLTAIILVDTMNVKNATSRQAEAVYAILDRLRKRPLANEMAAGPGPKPSYTPLDVFSGMVLGIIVAVLIF